MLRNSKLPGLVGIFLVDGFARDKLLMLRMESCSKWNNQKEFGQCSERIGTIKTTGLIVHMLAK